MKLKRAIAWLAAALVSGLGAGCGACATEKSYAVNDYRTTMAFRDGFKILQLTDLHLGIESDLQKQLDLAVSAVEKETPDLVVLTGDNFMYASKAIVDNLTKTMNEVCKAQTELHPERLTKFAITYGNHDNQGDYHRYYCNSSVKKYAAKDGEEVAQNKYAAFIDYEDDDLFGLTNYFIDLVDDRAASTDEVDVKYRLHVIDSNTYTFMGTKYGYDVIHEEQLTHAQNIFQNATADKDYIGMAFFHIPFVQYEEARLQYQAAENPALVGQGEFREGVLFPYTDNGSYHKLRAANILSFVVGHNHRNYGDVIYNAASANLADKAIFSFGVKTTNQLYHDTDMLGYKVITLRENMSQEAFVSIENVNENFVNKTDGGEYYA